MDSDPAMVERADLPEEDSSKEMPPPGPFQIVGIGASAGGLEALEQFLRPTSKSTGMAFVVIQHLDPARKGIMPELLQRTTEMKVVQVKDRMRIQPDTVYVIPPNKDMSILHGVLHLFPPAEPRGLRLPIDFFLRSLAEDQRERSVAVILSGMGSDGTLGIRAIKEAGGLVVVQEPSSAKFDGMPRSAVNTGLVDLVAPAEALCERLISCLRHTPLHERGEPAPRGRTEGALEKAIILLRDHTGHDFSQYKKSTLYRRIERRMGIHQIDKIAHYVRFLQENPVERAILFKELLIGVTCFFRDPQAWEHLEDRVLPALFARNPEGVHLRAWCAGCSTGEEAYSLAMVFKETLAKVQPSGPFTLQIFATDLDSDAIAKARQGHYPENISADLTPDRLREFFFQEEGGYRIDRRIREMVTLAPHNIITAPPFTKLDLLVCRNLLIYLEPDLQKKLLPLFHYSLNPGGTLFLGGAESIGGHFELFETEDAKWRIYRRKESYMKRRDIEFPSSPSGNPAGPYEEMGLPAAAPNLQTAVERLILRQYAPCVVLVSGSGDIAYLSGQTEAYLELPAGKANWNLSVMAREGLRYELINALKSAVRKKVTVTVRGLTVKFEDHANPFDVVIEPINDPEALRGMFLLVFKEAPSMEKERTRRGERTSRGHAPLDDRERQELQYLRGELTAIREQSQASQEENRATNEELQSANEELQSTNEELVTSKEEMQSLNEELQSVNAELQSKMDDLVQASNDMNNLLNSTEVATLFLDKDFNVRRFTPQTAKIIRLVPSDVGRLITDIISDLLYPELLADMKEVLRTLVPVEKQVATQDGRWYRIRIMPYRTLDNVIDGLVTTYMDISVSKKLEAELRQLRDADRSKPREEETP